ncbi:uncharacterized protein LOC112589872 [Harpegnathos saltator]|uniref:uncharacterized protein LOC112589872 n=1 Tax=Harpegnathos saltator TaxID=610380 RepID=UPI000DBEEDE3|nr:uncharacterized protein LOC112589872 [Harpegnathos saltator]
MADKKLLVVVSSIICSQIDEEDYDEISSSSSSDSNDNKDDFNDEEIDMRTLYVMLMANKTRGQTRQVEKVNDYVERVIPGYSKITFKEHFRMFPETFQIILRLLRAPLNATNARGRKQISAEKQLLITLWYMATPDSSICVRQVWCGKGHCIARCETGNSYSPLSSTTFY